MTNTDPHDGQCPRFSGEEVKKIARELYEFNATTFKEFGSYTDQNFYLQDESGREFVFKISNPAEDKNLLDMQVKAIEYLTGQMKNYRIPNVIPMVSGERLATVKGPDGADYFVRMLSYLPGEFLGDIESYTPEILHGIGHLMGAMDKAFAGFTHRAANRHMKWDLKNMRAIIPIIEYIADPELRIIVEHFLLQFDTFVVPALPDLRSGIIHNDGNECNIMVKKDEAGKFKISGIIDFGDMLYTHIVSEPAIAAAYAVLGQKNEPGLIETAARVIGGYHAAFPLTGRELEIIFYLICARLCISVSMSAFRRTLEPDSEYLLVSAAPAGDVLKKLVNIDPLFALRSFRRACNLGPAAPKEGRSSEEILTIRRRHLGPTLSISYNKPLKIIRGSRQYLYDESGQAYLDCVNNVCHVGHCHPRVVRAAQRQMAILNTNTRYLHDNIVEYARRLCETLPEALSICFFVNSGSEANDLALRLARTHTGSLHTIVVDHAYHGNLSSLIEISAYKFDGPGGSGAAPHIHKVAMPDVYRGLYKASDPEAGKKYAGEVRAAVKKLRQAGEKPAVFICESLPGVGGQIVLPENYLKEAYRYVREAGGVCIADEVQVGFGRVGTHFWGFETQGVTPDIVTFGKPIGNGHPLAAVVTTPEIAASFSTGMEYFNTFGGNPVSCAAGLAVLDVIGDEKLQENSLKVGSRLKVGLKALIEKYRVIGDVRGMGLFIGIELVKDRESLEPAKEEAAVIVERMKEKGVLLSVDGPLHNVLKIKPPIVFNEENADFVVHTLDEVLSEDSTIGKNVGSRKYIN
jgi:4-aminobutyrate aminotransferase-like enzyme/Ser/Thr protein kinase RdoA (MazF antagonist)